MKVEQNRTTCVSRAGFAAFLVAMFALSAVSAGCGKKKASKAKEDEAIKLAVREDSKLQESQDDLLRRRGSLVRQRDRLEKQRTALEEKKKALVKGDAEAAAAIKEEEKKLNAKEKDILKQEAEVDSRLGTLLKQRNALLAKATAAISSGGGTPEVGVTRREASMAKRESALARREADLARREADLAKREKELAKGCAGMGGPVYTVTKIQVPAGGGAKRYTASDVQSVYSKALHLMSSRGIRSSDLPSGVSRLKKDIAGYIKKKQFYRGKYAADQFYKIVKSIKIDRAFVGAKMARLHRYIRRKKLGPDKEKKVNDLLRQATSAYSDGRFKKANSRLNKIYSVAQ